MADSPSHSERFGPFPTLSARLDDLDERVGGGGFALVSINEDLNAWDLAAAFRSGAVTVACLPASPPPTAINLPDDVGGIRGVAFAGVDPTALDILVDGTPVTDPALWAAGRWPDFNGVEAYWFAPATSGSGWAATPAPSAAGVPPSSDTTFAVMVDISGAVPLWYLEGQP